MIVVIDGDVGNKLVPIRLIYDGWFSFKIRRCFSTLKTASFSGHFTVMSQHGMFRTIEIQTLCDKPYQKRWDRGILLSAELDSLGGTPEKDEEKKKWKMSSYVTDHNLIPFLNCLFYVSGSTHRCVVYEIHAQLNLFITSFSVMRIRFKRTKMRKNYWSMYIVKNLIVGGE